MVFQPLVSQPVALRTKADAARFEAARFGFLFGLCSDPRVSALYARWRGRQVRALRALKRPTTEAAIIGTIGPTPQMLDEAIALVRDELHLSWAWVADDLIGVWVADAGTTVIEATVKAGRATGRPVALRWRSRMVLPCSPEVNIPLQLHKEPGESDDQALKRLMSDAAKALIEHGGPSLPNGRPMPDKGRNLKFWALGFYATRVADPPVSVYAIGAAYRRLKFPDVTRTARTKTAAGLVPDVRDFRGLAKQGIEAAKRALSLPVDRIRPL